MFADFLGVPFQERMDSRIYGESHCEQTVKEAKSCNHLFGQCGIVV